jgi:hypothetical protein
MSVGPRQFHETLRVFVVGKNYRLQNIQLSKIGLASTAGKLVYVGSVGAPLARLRALARGVKGSAQQPAPTSARARLESLTRAPKLFFQITSD